MFPQEQVECRGESAQSKAKSQASSQGHTQQSQQGKKQSEWDTFQEKVEDEYDITEKAMDAATIIVSRCEDLLLSFLQEVMHVRFPEGSKIRYLSERSAWFNPITRLLEQREGDTFLKVVDPNERALMYVHIECQTSYDKTISVRSLRYSLDDSVKVIFDDKGGAEDKDMAPVGELPAVIVIQIRDSTKMPTSVAFMLHHSGCESRDTLVPIINPVVRMADYSLEQLCTKNLLVLLPFWFVHYEKEFKKDVLSKEVINQIREDYRQIRKKLALLVKRNEVSIMDAHKVENALTQVFLKMAKNHLSELKEVLNQMHGVYLANAGQERNDALLMKIQAAEHRAEEEKNRAEVAEGKFEKANLLFDSLFRNLTPSVMGEGSGLLAQYKEKWEKLANATV